MGNIIRHIFHRISNFFTLFLKFFRRKHPKPDKKEGRQEEGEVMSR